MEIRLWCWEVRDTEIQAPFENYIFRQLRLAHIHKERTYVSWLYMRLMWSLLNMPNLRMYLVIYTYKTRCPGIELLPACEFKKCHVDDQKR